MIRGILLFAAVLALPVLAVEREKPSFGFSGPETFPIDFQVANLRVADIDGDGLNDLVVVNNSRSRINVLVNQTGKTNAAQSAQSRLTEINELPPDSRFRIESIASEKRIAALVVADLNHDKRPDIAYYGEPKELVVQLNQGTNGWSAPRRWAIEDGVLSPNALATGDLNGDGYPDLVLLGENHIYLLHQHADGTLDEPDKIAFAGLVRSVQVLDVNGDGREDLLLVNWDTPNPLRFRLQGPHGELGPETHFSMPPIRSYTADDLDGDKKTEIISIAQNSGRAQISSFVQREAEKLSAGFSVGQFEVMPLAKTGKARRGASWGDVNGDGLEDLVVAEPESGQLSVFLQETNGALAAGKVFSTLTGISDITIGPWDGTNRPAIFLLSSDERAVAVTHFDQNGKIGFPTSLPFEGRPLAMALGTAEKGSKPVLAVLLDQDGRRVLTIRTASGEAKTIKLSESFKSTPTSMAWHDANQDGLADIVMLVPYEKVRILVQKGDKGFEEAEVQAGGGMEQPWMTRADVDGDGKPELLLPQRNFMRAVVLKSDTDNTNATNRTWAFAVKEQINGAANNSRLVGAVPVRGTNPVPLLFLLDAERKSVTVSERGTNGAWEIVRNVQLPFTEFSELQSLSLGGAKMPNAVAFLGLNAAGCLKLYGKAWEITELDGYETPIRDARLNDVVTGDLNQDGRKDLVFLETAKNYLDLVIFDKEGRLVPANRWPVFEERSFRGRRGGESQEPREAVIADLTGDGKKDLGIIVHDRVLVYPQE